jgi:nucleoside-diphosphate-sugar epimerase
MRTIVITGITGKSGQYLLHRLMCEEENLSDFRFLLLCRKHADDSVNTEGYQLVGKALKSAKLNIRLMEADLSDPDEIEAVFQEPVDMLFHIASVKLSWNIVPIAMKHGVDQFVLVHTTGIYSKYKAAGEEYRQIETKISALVEEYKNQGREIAVTILRPTMIYGDLNDKNISVFIKMVDKLRVFPTVNSARYDLQPVWCKDLGDAYFNVMMNWSVTQNKEYILSGGEPIQLREMFEVIAKQLGVKNIFISCPYPIAYAGAWVIYAISLKKIDFREKVQRLVEPRAYLHDEATKDFGFAPVAFDIGVKDEIEQYKWSKIK